MKTATAYKSINIRAFTYFACHNLKTRLLRQRIPLLAGVKLTHRCNLQCRVCPFWRNPAPDISFTQVKDNLRELRDMGVRLVVFEGGEPFLWRDGEHRLDDVIAFAKSLFFSVGVTTNGTLPLACRADTLWVSVDGLRESHNYNRGECFDRVIANIESSPHPHLCANITINSINHRDIPELVRFLASRVVGITVQFYYPYEGTEELWLSHTARVEILNELIALKRAGLPLIDSVAALKALKDNTWRCHPWLIANVEPDGTINHGCYLRKRAAVNCRKCGFAAHAEMSLAYDLHPAAILAGIRTFGL